MSHLSQAIIHWTHDDQGNEVPISQMFDDVYFSHGDGFLESRYVFIEQNHLPSRFERLFKEGGRFVIVETGFGTGLNFLSTCELWQHLAQANVHTKPILHFISTEKYPLSCADLTKALTPWRAQYPALSTLIDALISAYPLPMAGCHRRYFDVAGTTVILDLWLADAKDSFVALANQPHLSSPPKVDAWFLDGFAPKKNHQLWSDELFCVIGKLSHAKTTLATFTAAGDVKRALAKIGAKVNKVKGYGRKRDMLTAHFDTAPPTHQHLTPKSALVVGAGVSGLFCAYALAMRGIAVTLVDKSAPLAGASGNPKALLCPKLSTPQGASTHLATVSYLYAQACYTQLSQLNTAIFHPIGVIDCLLPTQKSAEKLHALVSAYPSTLIYPIAPWTHTQFSALVPSAGIVCPKSLAQTILAHPLINFQAMAVSQMENAQHSTVLTDGTHTLSADIAIICAGWQSHLLDERIFNCRHIRGQVSWLKDSALAQQVSNTTQTHAIKYDGYACTFNDDNPNDQTPTTLLFGASFVRNDTNDEVRHDDHLFNLSKFNQAFPDTTISADALQGRASIRAQTPDYHPIVGQLDTQVYVMTGMGSKGFAFAPFCAEILSAMIFGEFFCTTTDLIQKLSPQRARLQIPLDHSA